MVRVREWSGGGVWVRVCWGSETHGDKSGGEGKGREQRLVSSRLVSLNVRSLASRRHRPHLDPLSQPIRRLALRWLCSSHAPSRRETRQRNSLCEAERGLRERQVRERTRELRSCT